MSESITKKPDQKNNKKTKNKKRSLLRKVIAILILFIVISGLGTCTAVYIIGRDMIASAPEVSKENMESLGSSKILDADGNTIAEVGQQIRTNITYEDLPESLIDAFVSIEDSRFFEHPGFDISRFVKAMIENVKATLSAGRIVFAQGGSTLTMQLIDNAYFKSDTGPQGDNDIEQKVWEIFMAMELEKTVTKQEVLEFYLNKVNFGGAGNIRGVQKAAEYYFSKNVNELTLAESAMLAGLVNAPNRYNPMKNLEAATSRRDTVLYLMERHGYISNEEANLARSIRVEDLLKIDNTAGSKTSASSGIPYQSYVDAVIDEVIQLTKKDPTTTPMIIHTYMRPDVQATIDQIQNGEITDIEFMDDLMQIAIVCMDNRTGEIVGLGGGRNYEGERMFNRATDMYKQPGSSVKPFLSYALAFEKLGWSTSHVVTDKPILYKGTDKVINNFDGVYRGDMTLQDAIGTSMNTPAIQALESVVYEIGRNEVINYLNDLGFNQVNSNNFDLGYAIGGSSFTVTPLQMAAAHATMINHGNYNTPHTVAKIEFLDGSEPIINDPEERKVLSDGAAYLTSLMMEQCVSGPYINYMQILERSYPVYAKTGTTNWGEEAEQYDIPVGSSKDKWMISSTTEYTTAVWFGYDKGVEGEDTYFNNAKSRLNTPGRISSLLLDTLTDENNMPSAITRPEEIVEITHILGTFPYATAPGYEYLNTTGLIKEEFSEVTDVYSSAPQGLDSIGISRSEDGATVKVVWNATGFEPVNEEGLKDLSLYAVVSTEDEDEKEIYVEAYGKQLFSYAWILGQPHFVSQVYVNGSYYGDVYSDTGVGWGWFEPGQLKACGYYYTDGGYTSNTVCSN